MDTKDLVLCFYRALLKESKTELCDLRSCLCSENVDWEELLSTIKHHKLQVLFYNHFKNIIPDSIRCYFSQEYHQALAWQNVLLDELEVICSAFSKAEIPFLLLKGFTIGKKVYGSEYMRPTNDLDLLLLNPDDLGKAQELAEKLDYAVFYKKKDYTFGVLPKGYRMKHTGYHETQYSKVISDGVFIDAELHLNTGSLGQEIIDFFKDDPEWMEIGQNSVRIMNRLNFFMYLCANSHENFELNFSVYNNTYIRDVLDVVLYAKKFITKDDWSLLEQLSKKYGIFHRLCAVLYYSNELAGENIWDSDVLERFTYRASEREKLYDNGAYVDWSMRFVDRVFNKEKRCIEYSNKYVEHCFSCKNPNSVPYNANDGGAPYMSYFNETLKLPIVWRFFVNSGGLIISFKDLEKSIPSSEYSIALKFLISPELAYSKGGNPMETFSVEKRGCAYIIVDEDNQVICAGKNNNCVYDFEIPLARLYMYNGSYSAYNIIVCKQVYNDCLEWCGGVFEDYNPKGELGVICLGEQRSDA